MFLGEEEVIFVFSVEVKVVVVEVEDVCVVGVVEEGVCFFVV